MRTSGVEARKTACVRLEYRLRRRRGVVPAVDENGTQIVAAKRQNRPSEWDNEGGPTTRANGSPTLTTHHCTHRRRSG
mgnify:CR=1 FL=1